MAALDARDLQGAITKAIHYDPSHIKAWQWRGEVRSELGHHEAAVVDLTRALETTESAAPEVIASWGADHRQLLSEILYERAQVLERLGRHEEARADRARREALEQDR